MEIKRKFMAHFINAAALLATTPIYERLGKDLEEFSIELNPNVETKQNILGESTTKVDGYQPSSSVEPYYADEGTNLFNRLQDIIDNRRTLDELKTDAVEVHLWEPVVEGTSYIAYREDIIFEVSSYGGDTTGYQIPFTIHYIGNRVKGVFNVLTKTFTPNSGTMGTLQIELAAGTTALNTKVTDVIGEGSGTLKYKISSSITAPSYGDADTDYTALTLNTDLACASATNKIIVVASTSGSITAASAITKVICPA